MTDRNPIETAAFKAMQAVTAAEFQLLMAYKYGHTDSLESAREHLLDALDGINAALLAVKSEVAA